MNLPSLEKYVETLSIILADAPQSYRQMLDFHFHARDYEATATELAQVAGYKNYSAANLHYGKLARRVCEALEFYPPVGNSGDPTFTYVLAKSRKLPDEDWLWTLHPVVVQALNLLYEPTEPVNQSELEQIHAEEVPNNRNYIEGSVIQRLVNARERDPAVRLACLNYWGTDCSVCGLDSSVIYGVSPDRFIHVHHLQPLSTLTQATAIDPKDDLRPVCPNCHSALHSTDPPMSINALRAKMRRLRGKD